MCKGKCKNEGFLEDEIKGKAINNLLKDRFSLTKAIQYNNLDQAAHEKCGSQAQINLAPKPEITNIIFS